MRVRFPLLARIYLATAVAVTILFAAAGWFFLYQASAAMYNGLEQEVRASLATADASLESRTEHLATASALLASMSDIRSAFGTRDAATIRDTAGEFWARAQAGHKHVETAVFVVAGPDGVVMVEVAGRTPSGLKTGRALPASILEPARRGFPKQNGAFARLDDAVWQILMTPLYVDSGSHASLLNILVAAHPITREVLQDLKERTRGIDFLLRSAGRTALTTLEPEAAARVAAQPEKFAIRSTVLRDDDGQELAQLWAVRSFEEVEARIGDLRRTMIVAWMIAIIAGLALSYFLARRIVRPVRMLTHAAGEVARENFAVRVPESSQDELGVLARSFNQMAASIRAARDEQLRSGQILAIGRLAASIAHDLRNPLSAVVSGSEMLAEFDLRGDQIKQTASHVNKAAHRMEHLLEELGQVARGKPGERQVCAVEELVASAVGAVQATAEAQHVTITRDVQGPLELRCDRSRVERVMVNLMANSLEVMPSGGAISVRAWSGDGNAWIEFTDTGPGVPAEIRATLFQPFVTAGKKDGLGLGLALARQTMLEHGGELALMSSSQGACFRLRLPFA